MVRFIELFAGIGGFRLGLESKRWLQEQGNGDLSKSPCQQNFHCVWANELDKYACQIYRKRLGKEDWQSQGKERTRSAECVRSIGNSTHIQGEPFQCNQDSNWHEPSKLYEGDIRTVDPATIPEHDLICAGFPCQSFSVAGKRGGFEDTRGTLFFEICRIAGAKRTPYLLLENVKGLLSHDDGSTFQAILGTLDELGYDCQWQVLNRKDFGVPQNRERVFIIGHLRGEPRPKVFPIGETMQDDSKLECSTEPITACLSAAGAGEWHSGMQLTGTLQRVRRLTPIECERLQGFPDNWTEGISDTQRYKCLGNAVTVNVIEAIGRQFVEGLK